MPARIPLVARLRPHSGTSFALLKPTTTTASPSPSTNDTPIPSSSTTTLLPLRPASTLAQRRRHQDPYAAAQARARKAANLSRQSVLEASRAKARGDPVRGVTRTPLIEAFKSGTPLFSQSADAEVVGLDETDVRAPTIASTAKGPATHFRNYFLNDPLLGAATAESRFLRTPLPSSDPRRDAQAVQRHRTGHDTASEALARITSLENASSKDRTRVNVQRCVELFGRHNTDGFLRERLKGRGHLPRKNLALEKGVAAIQTQESESAEDAENFEAIKSTSEPVGSVVEGTANATDGAAATATATTEEPPTTTTLTPRAGPDTGSPEVQIGILTARINTLADALDFRGRNDKVNKRNLRLLVHKRQKMLKYLRKSDRGGERWQRCVGMLGLGEACWVGEITM